MKTKSSWSRSKSARFDFKRVVFVALALVAVVATSFYVQKTYFSTSSSASSNDYQESLYFMLSKDGKKLFYKEEIQRLSDETWAAITTPTKNWTEATRSSTVGSKLLPVDITQYPAETIMNYVFTYKDIQYFNFTITYKQDGVHKMQTRDCPIGKNSGILWEQCSRWYDVSSTYQKWIAGKNFVFGAPYSQAVTSYVVNEEQWHHFVMMGLQLVNGKYSSLIYERFCVSNNAIRAYDGACTDWRKVSSPGLTKIASDLKMNEWFSNITLDTQATTGKTGSWFDSVGYSYVYYKILQTDDEDAINLRHSRFCRVVTSNFQPQLFSGGKRPESGISFAQVDAQKWECKPWQTSLFKGKDLQALYPNKTVGGGYESSAFIMSPEYIRRRKVDGFGPVPTPTAQPTAIPPVSVSVTASPVVTAPPVDQGFCSEYGLAEGSCNRNQTCSTSLCSMSSLQNPAQVKCKLNSANGVYIFDCCSAATTRIYNGRCIIPQ